MAKALGLVLSTRGTEKVPKEAKNVLIIDRFEGDDDEYAIVEKASPTKSLK